MGLSFSLFFNMVNRSSRVPDFFRCDFFVVAVRPAIHLSRNSMKYSHNAKNESV